jgi:signal transduction histidine kinase
MQERATQIEARFQLTSEPGRGTVLEVQAPLQ